MMTPEKCSLFLNDQVFSSPIFKPKEHFFADSHHRHRWIQAQSSSIAADFAATHSPPRTAGYFAGDDSVIVVGAVSTIAS